MLPNICSTKKKTCFDCLIPYTVIPWNRDIFWRRLSYRENLIPLQPYMIWISRNKWKVHVYACYYMQWWMIAEQQFCHDNSLRDWHGNVHSNVNVFGLGGIDLLRCCCCGRACTEICYCQYIHNMLLWACKKYCCSKYNTHIYITYMKKKPVAYMNHLIVEGFRNTLQTAIASTSHIFECWAESSLATHKKMLFIVAF